MTTATNSKNVHNFLLLFFNQVVSRLFTFVLNLLTLRHIGATAFGIVSIHLYLIYTTILFLIREPCRTAALHTGFTPLISKSSSSTPCRTAAYAVYTTMKTIMTIVVSVSSLLSVLLLVVYAFRPPALPVGFESQLEHLSQQQQQQPTLDSITFLDRLHDLIPPNIFISNVFSAKFDAIPMFSYYMYTTISFVIAALIELSVEHLFIYYQRIGRTGLRVLAESSANLTKCIVTYASVMLFVQWFHNMHVGTALLCCAIGQLGYSMALAVVFFSAALYDVHSSKPRASSAPSSSHDQQDVAPLSHIAQVLPFLPFQDDAGAVTKPQQQSHLHINTIWSLTSFDFEYLKWSINLGLSSILKHVLTEAEKFALVLISPFTPEENGSYALVTNLGGLFARLLFQPLEEQTSQSFAVYHREITAQRSIFQMIYQEHMSETQNLVQTDKLTQETATTSPNSDSVTQRRRDVRSSPKQPQGLHDASTKSPLHQPQQQQQDQQQDQQQQQWTKLFSNPAFFQASKRLLQTQTTLLQQIKVRLTIATYIGLILCAFGPAGSYSVVRLLYGAKIADGSITAQLLALYACAQLFFALNGVIEATLTSTRKSANDIASTNLLFIVCSLSYSLVCIAGIKIPLLYDILNIQTFILANVFTMTLRIIFALRHIVFYFHSFSEEFHIVSHSPIEQIDNFILHDLVSSSSPSTSSSSPSSSSTSPSTSSTSSSTTTTTRSEFLQLLQHDDVQPPTYFDLFIAMLPHRTIRFLLFVITIFNNIIATHFVFHAEYQYTLLNTIYINLPNRMIIRNAMQKYGVDKVLSWMQSTPVPAPPSLSDTDLSSADVQLHHVQSVFAQLHSPSSMAHFYVIGSLAISFVMIVGAIYIVDRHRFRR